MHEKGDKGNFPIHLYKQRLKGKQEGEELPGENHGERQGCLSRKEMKKHPAESASEEVGLCGCSNEHLFDASDLTSSKRAGARECTQGR